MRRTEHKTRGGPVRNSTYNVIVVGESGVQTAWKTLGVDLGQVSKYRGADKSLARPGRKQATATKLTFASHSKKKIISLSVQPGLRGSNYLLVGRKMATFQLFFSVGLG